MRAEEIAVQLDELDTSMRLDESVDPLKIRFLLSRRFCPGEYLSLYAQKEYAINIFGKKQGLRIREIARTHTNLPRADIEEYIKWGTENYERLDEIAAVLRNRVLLTEDIERLLASATYWYARTKTLRLTASNPRFPVTLYEEALNTDSPYVVSALASNPAISLDIIERIMLIDNFKILEALVRNSTVKKNMVAKLLEPPFKPEFFPSYLLMSIAQRLPDGEEFDNAMKIMSERADSSATKQFVAIWSRDIADLSKKCVDNDVKVRIAAMKNTLTPESAKVAGALLGTPITINPRGGLHPRKRVW